MNYKISFLITARNESQPVLDATINGLLETTARHPREIIVIDDGSDVPIAFMYPPYLVVRPFAKPARVSPVVPDQLYPGACKSLTCSNKSSALATSSTSLAFNRWSGRCSILWRCTALGEPKAPEVKYVRTCPNLPAGRSLSAGYGAEGLSGSLSPGVHIAEVFDPAFQFEVGKDWESVPPETIDQVWLETGPKGGQLFFTNPLYYVFDPSNPSEAKEIPVPESAKEWLSWFQRHPNLEISKPVPVSVGGASGVQIDVTASSTPKKYPREICGRKPCVPLYPTSGGPISSRPSGTGKDRYVILDVGGETVIINIAARAGKFDAFSPKAKKVLNSVEWKGG